ncbi:MAG: DMT family transporter [Chloroflexi bacterium]|nr:MAG: DMT family transporter [Chloroflexota bacterium]
MLNKRIISPELMVAVSAGVWGLFWIPLRAFDRMGLDPGWVVISQFSAPFLLLAPLAVVRLRRGQRTGLEHFRTGLLVGGAVVLYSESVLLTDVVRALILFYVMPAWGTLAEVYLMGRRFTLWRGLALVLSLGGLVAILGIGSGPGRPVNLGDGLALLSGIVFTFGAMRIRRSPDISVFEQVLAFFFYGTLVAGGLSLLPLAALGHPPDLPRFLAVTPWVLLMSGGILIPAMWGLYWGSRFVDPGRLGILLQIEAVVGIGSAALLAGEPFGLPEALGSAMVIGAGLVEVFGNRGPLPANKWDERPP